MNEFEHGYAVISGLKHPLKYVRLHATTKSQCLFQHIMCAPLISNLAIMTIVIKVNLTKHGCSLADKLSTAPALA